MLTILAKLTPPAVVKVVELPDLPDHGDIVDWIDDHGDAAEPEELRRQVEALANEAVAIQSVRPAARILQFQPFPTDTLPEPMRGFVVAGAKAMGCDTSYFALPMLTSVAAAIGNTRRIQLKRGWTEPAILWTAIVGDSGIRLEAHGDRLRYSPRSAVTPDLAERMTAHKAELLALLRPEADPVESTDHEAESISEAMEIIDPPDPCPECGTLEQWQTVAGNWRCLRCDPPTKARRLRERADRLRGLPRRNSNDDR